MSALCCDRCGQRIGWMNDSAPRGSVYCDDCKEKDDADDEARTLADAHSKNPPEEKSPTAEATGLSEIAGQRQPEAEHG